MRKITILAACLACVCILHAQVTIENLLSVPFPTELKSSRDGKHIAWIFNDKGVRNVFAADAPAFVPRMLTTNTDDNGVDITGLVFSPDGSRVFFTQGNSRNGEGEPANPALLQEKTGMVVCTVNLDGTGLRKIAEGNGAAPSPDGTQVAFYAHGKIWTAGVTDTTKKPDQLFEARGGLDGATWRPDGKVMAFVSNRGDHAFIGLYDLNKNTISYPDPSVDIDIQPVWSPDGKWLAYMRVPNRKDGVLFVEQRTGSPWSIRVLNVATGEAKEVWHASEGVGSVLFTDFPVADNLLQWAAGNTLVFPWERDGWQHLYAVDAISGGTARLLTPGDGEVENMVLSPDGKNIVYNTNIGDMHRRHIWQVQVSGGSPVQLSKGQGIEWSAAITQAGVAVIQSTATTPGWPGLVNADGSVSKIGASLFPPNFPAAALVMPQLVSFTAKDGMTIHGELFLPPNYQVGKKYPALLFFHGGSRRQMLLGFHYMDYYSNDYAMNQYYASKGYIVLAVNYRSGIGYGMAFREALHYGANGASEYNDVIGAGLYMRSRPDVIATRIGLWGGSYGGYLTAMGLSRNSDVFAAGVDIHGVHDWNEEMKNWVANYDPATRTAFAALATASSPVHFVDGWKSPVLFIHGDDDRNVPFNQTVNIVEKLRERHIYFEQLIIPDEIHDFLLHKTWIKGYYAGADFFERKMK